MERATDTGPGEVTLFLCGDVMTGRGIDQALPHPCEPTLHEWYVEDAREYVRLAEAASGPIPAPVSFEYIWGDLLGELEAAGPAARIINLETSITHSDDHAVGKAIHYRVSPENAACLTAARVDVCCLANNHVLDWGVAGLHDTLATLDQRAIGHAGAGPSAEDAEAPAIVEHARGRVLVFAACSPGSGVPLSWAATGTRPGVNLLVDLSRPELVPRMRRLVDCWRRERDLVVLSIHWGPNWGYEIAPEKTRLARRLIDEAGIDLVHGHSAHHVKGIEVHDGKLILYGCGDLITDYEGIRGHELYRGELGLAYLPTLDAATGALRALRMMPTRLARFRLGRAAAPDARWLEALLCQQGAALGTSAVLGEDGWLSLRWAR